MGSCTNSVYGVGRKRGCAKTMPGNSLAVSKVSKSFNSQKVFDALSFDVDPGDRVEIVGPSGIGKTTLLNILASYDTPSSGHVSYGGEDLTAMPTDRLADYRQRLGFVFQEPLIIGDLTGMENILLPFVPRAGVEVEGLKSGAARLADELGVNTVIGHKANTMSTGEKKRMEMIRALVRNPEILILDEPTANLDEEAATMIIRIVKEQADLGRCVVFSVHRDEKLMSIANKSVRLLDYK